jgi:glyoxylase-like metal-dependent hydrolase (beta-lactamase superfamily II)
MLPGMQVRTVVVGYFEVNCVVLWQDPAQAWVVDPGGDAKGVRALLQREKLQVAHYLGTHGHVDHLAALDDLLAAHPATVWLHEADARWAFSPANRIPPAYPAPPHRPETLCSEITDGQLLSAGGLTARVITTPGHTPGCLCLYFEEARLLLSGDTLFAGSVGRTDLPGSDTRELQRSLKKLLTLPAETRVIAGHGPQTSLGVERRTNPHLQD